MTGQRWLAEGRRAYTGLSLGLVVMVGWVLARPVLPEAWQPNEVEIALLAVAVYLMSYLAVTVLVFARMPTRTTLSWAARSEPGTWFQHFVLGTKPGAGVATMVSVLALMAAVFWLPEGDPGSTLSQGARGVLAAALVVMAWLTVALTHSLAYLCADARSGHRMLAFPGEGPRSWTDYLYFSISLTTTFAASDVQVLHPRMRRSVAAHGVVAFVFNTVILAAVVSVLLR